MKRWLQDRLGRSDADSLIALDGAVIGDLEGPTAIVDAKGRVAVIDGSWWLEWGVGDEDRWRIAHDEVAVRQSRVADAPVYETSMRISGGDVVQRIASANDGLGRVLVVEFENASANAVAVALAGRVPAAAAIRADADGVALDDIEWIRAERPAGGVFAVLGDPWPTVAAGPDDARAQTDGADAAGGLVLALPHRQLVRFEVLLDGDFPTRPMTPEDIAAGWRVVTGDALTIEVPDADLGEAWTRIVPDLIVSAGSDDPRAAAEAAVVLDIAGLLDEADRARAVVVGAAEAGELRGDDATAALRALASRDLLGGQESGLAALAGPLAALAGRSIDAATLEMVARALDGPAPEAAGDARRAASSASGSFGAVSPAAIAAANVLCHVIDVSDTASIAVLPDVPDSWRGQQIDVRNCGTANGRVSFSVRWHGSRPALLWERHGGSDSIEMRCPGLDPSWSTLERSGEALLAEPAD
ncbi:MAG: hypothetical protein P8J50_13160 [Acidimicrobiales bacterium]|nr:hypothetical protein [Acidimicrobiales bacterium]